ncbi:hypothetical protein [Desulforhopalus sp. IMCC35007]|uniref:hypothetical protein n=1 Tax=Desulforhopalus sp. IMCC35007 TaxID=2569543 RepID=UPI0010AE3070|nr:hypothetical protein [Desulforhopalus sp. IMCC35007]TKB07455.1 hypothetical protein FCL48_17085 [Desulforhopalus sp. IMCC35007]
MQYPSATGQPLEQPEVVLNLWAYTTEYGHVMRISGKTYTLQGSDQEKLKLLRCLSASDFVSVPWRKVPANFKQISPDGQEIRGVASASLLSDPISHSHIFGPLIEELAASLPEQICSYGGEYRKFKMELPADPLAVTTIVIEQEDGQLVPMVSGGSVL